VRNVACIHIELDEALLHIDQVANLQSPNEGTIATLDRWMEGTQPINDCSKNFLESAIPRGNVNLRRKIAVDHSELATISRHADSWLTTLLKQTPLRYLFLVCIIKVVKNPWTLLTGL
jgi:hypothetical protein